MVIILVEEEKPRLRDRIEHEQYLVLSLSQAIYKAMTIANEEHSRPMLNRRII